MVSPSSPASRRAAAPLLAALTLLSAAGAGCGNSSGSLTPPPQPPTELAADGTAYQVITPADYGTGGFNVTYPNLGVDERVAVLPIAAGTTGYAVTVAVTGTSGAVGKLDAAPAARAVADGLGTGGQVEDAGVDRSALLAGHELARQRRESFLARTGGAPGLVTPALPRSAAILAAVASAVGDTRAGGGFCVFQYVTKATHRYPATLRYTTPHAEFWVLDAAWPSFQSAITNPANWSSGVARTTDQVFASLGTAYESKILSALQTYFGPESDVDGNTKMIFLFADLMGGAGTNGTVVGYFDPTDVYYPRDVTSACASGSSFGSNGADMLYLIDPTTFHAAGFSLDTIVDEEWPGTMAHELQHNVNFNVRCLQQGKGASCVQAPPTCAAEIPAGATSSQMRQQENTWINEGLSMVSEDVAGFGAATPSERSRLRQYLASYPAWSLTCWESDPIGNYGGAHAYMRYWLDQIGPGFTMAMENPALHGKANVASATGVSFEQGFARFAAASLVSNEDTAVYGSGVLSSPGTISSLASGLSDSQFSYGAFLPGGALASQQPVWAPWHHYTRSCTPASGPPLTRTFAANATYTPVASTAGVTLRQDGWATFVTRGTGGPATVSVTPSSGGKPHVALVRYTGALPNAVPAVCQ